MYINENVGIRVSKNYRISSEEIDELIDMLGVDDAFDTILSMIETNTKKPLTLNQQLKLEDKLNELYVTPRHYRMSGDLLDELGIKK